MADVSDIEIKLVDFITNLIYPNGTVSGPISAVGGVLVDIRRGWPLPTTLDIAIASGNDVLVRVYPEPGMTRNTSRFVPEWREMAHVPPSLTVSVSGSVVSFGGTGDASHVAGVMVGDPPFAQAYAYRLQDGDGPTEVATALALLVGGSTGSSGGVVTLVTNHPVFGRVVRDQSAFLETRRQDQGFRVSIWSSNFAARDAVAKVIDEALANLLDVNGNWTRNLTLADGSAGWLRYRSTYHLDGAEKAGLYRRDLCYMVEYPTAQIQTFETVLFGVEAVTMVISTPGVVPPEERSATTTLIS